MMKYSAQHPGLGETFALVGLLPAPQRTSVIGLLKMFLQLRRPHAGVESKLINYKSQSLRL
jgi:hypothetical protein